MELLWAYFADVAGIIFCKFASWAKLMLSLGYLHHKSPLLQLLKLFGVFQRWALLNFDYRLSPSDHARLHIGRQFNYDISHATLATCFLQPAIYVATGMYSTVKHLALPTAVAVPFHSVLFTFCCTRRSSYFHWNETEWNKNVIPFFLVFYYKWRFHSSSKYELSILLTGSVELPSCTRVQL